MGLRFEMPDVSRVRRNIRDPKYAGAYIYGVNHWRRVEKGGAPAPEGRLIGQFVVNWKHHEGYITVEEYFDNQRILALNTNTAKQSQIGPGPALLQGRCRCAAHGAMAVRYNRHSRRPSWSFCCRGDSLRGGSVCISLPGASLEAHVATIVLKAIEAPVIEEAQRLWRSTHREWMTRHRGVEHELERLCERHDRLQRRLGEPFDSMRVRAMYEAECHKVDTEVSLLRNRLAQEVQEADPFTEARWEELKRLCADLPALWAAPTTTDQDRKQLIRLIIRFVEIQSVDREVIVARVHWADEQEPTVVRIVQSGHYHRLMWEWHLDGVCPDDIVIRLADMGARTQQGNVWSRATVLKTLGIMIAEARASQDAATRDVPPIRVNPHVPMLAMFRSGKDAQAIADQLNADGLLTRFGDKWFAASVRRVLVEKKVMPR